MNTMNLNYRRPMNKHSKIVVHSLRLLPLPLLLQIISLCISHSHPAKASGHSYTSSASQTNIPIHSCQNQQSEGGDDAKSIRPHWIHFSPHNEADNIGIIETPNFPKHFPLPVRCVWIFNNTASNSNTSLFLYFTRVRMIGIVFTMFQF